MKSVIVRIYDSSTLAVVVDGEIVAKFSYDDVGLERANKLAAHLKRTLI